MSKSKAIYAVGYTSYVLSLEDAVTVAEILSKAEVHEEKWHGGGKPNTQHIYENSKNDLGVIRLISETFYHMAKLAGPPSKEEA